MKLIFALTLAALLGGCSSPVKREARYMEHGLNLLAANRLVEAALEFRNAMRLRPTDPTPIYYAGLVIEAQGNFQEAFKTFRAAANQDRHFEPAALKLAQYLIAAGSLNEAAKWIDGLVKEKPRDAGAHAARASLLFHMQDNQGAKREALQALSLDLDDLLAAGVLIEIYAEAKDEIALVDALQRAQQRHNRNIVLARLAVSSFEKLNDISAEERAYRSLLELTPQDLETRLAFTKFYSSRGRTAEAEAMLRAGLVTSPNDAVLRRELVTYIDNTRGMQAAEMEIGAAISADPANTSYPFWLADLYRLHGDTDRARRQLIAIYHGGGDAVMKARAEVLLAKLALDAGLAVQAEVLAKQALAVRPGDAGALKVEAKLAFASGQLQSAVSTLRGISRENPADAEAARLLAEALLREGHPDLAADTLSDLIEHDTGDLEPLVRLAQIYNLLELTDRAQEMLAAITKVWPNEPLGWESMARIAIDLRDWPKADLAIDKLSALAGQAQLSRLLTAMETLRHDQTEKALPELLDVVRMDPTSGAAERSMDLLVRAELSRGACREAIALLTNLPLPVGTKSVGIGECQKTLGQYDAAAGSFDVAIAEKVPRSLPYIERAAIFSREKKFQQAVDVLEKGQAAAPGELAIPLMRADVSLAAGRYDDAMRLYSDMLDRDPGLDRVANNLAALIADHRFEDPGALRKARSLADRFRDSEMPEQLDTIGWVYYRQGEMTEALSIFARAEHFGKLTAAMQYHYGLALLSAGHSTDARRRLAVAAAADDFPGHQEAKEKLATF